MPKFLFMINTFFESKIKNVIKQLLHYSHTYKFKTFFIKNLNLLYSQRWTHILNLKAKENVTIFFNVQEQTVTQLNTNTKKNHLQFEFEIK